MKITHRFYSNTMEPSYDVHVLKQRTGVIISYPYLPLAQFCLSSSQAKTKQLDPTHFTQFKLDRV